MSHLFCTLTKTQSNAHIYARYDLPKWMNRQSRPFIEKAGVCSIFWVFGDFPPLSLSLRWSVRPLFSLKSGFRHPTCQYFQFLFTLLSPALLGSVCGTLPLIIPDQTRIKKTTDRPKWLPFASSCLLFELRNQAMFTRRMTRWGSKFQSRMNIEQTDGGLRRLF